MKLKKQRREEAEKRNTEFAKLSLQEKLAVLDKRGVVAKKQRVKILKKINKNNEVKETQEENIQQ